MKEIIKLRETEGKYKIKNSQVLFNNVQKIKIDYSQENFLCFFLDTKLNLISSEVIFKGGLNFIQIDPKIIFRRALINNSNYIIIAHNHPTGELNPSEEDVDIYEKLKKMGELIDLKVVDSVIFNKKSYYSINKV